MAQEKEITENETTDWTGIFSFRGLLLFCLLISSGCQMPSAGLRPRFPLLMHRSAKIPVDATKEEIVAYVNRHIEPIHSWQSTTARVHISGMPPVPLKAMIAVEQPKKLRLTVSMGLSAQSEFAVGSNPERLWFFARRMEPKAIWTVKQEDLAQLQNQMPIPFQPDWLMEVLNVAPIDASSASLVRDPDNPYIVKLISHHANEQGVEVRKSMTVDLRKGEIREHELFDAEHRLIASAELNDYKQFPNTEARLPYSIHLKLPEQDQSMRIELKSVEINPPELPSNLWAIPHVTGYAVRELGKEEILGSPAALANRRLREKPKAVTQYERDPQTGAWLKNQVIQTAHHDSAPSFSPAGVQSIEKLQKQSQSHQPGHSHQHAHGHQSEAIPFSSHAFASQPVQTASRTAATKKPRPAPLQTKAPASSTEQQPKTQKTDPPDSLDLPEWARGYKLPQSE